MTYTTEIYFLTVPEARKSDPCSEGSREEHFSEVFQNTSFKVWWLQASLGVEQYKSNLYLCLHKTISSFVFTKLYLLPCLSSNFPLLLRTLVFGLGPILMLYEFILAWLNLQRPYFQTRTQSEVLGRHNSTQYPTYNNTCNNLLLS